MYVFLECIKFIAITAMNIYIYKSLKNFWKKFSQFNEKKLLEIELCIDYSICLCYAVFHEERVFFYGKRKKKLTWLNRIFFYFLGMLLIWPEAERRLADLKLETPVLFWKLRLLPLGLQRLVLGGRVGYYFHSSEQMWIVVVYWYSFAWSLFVVGG